MNETVKIEYQSTNVRPVFGGKKIEVTYVMTHHINGRTNQYEVVCTVEGLQDHDPELMTESAKYIGDPDRTNDETLTGEAAQELFEGWS